MAQQNRASWDESFHLYSAATTAHTQAGSSSVPASLSSFFTPYSSSQLISRISPHVLFNFPTYIDYHGLLRLVQAVAVHEKKSDVVQLLTEHLMQVSEDQDLVTSSSSSSSSRLDLSSIIDSLTHVTALYHGLKDVPPAHGLISPDLVTKAYYLLAEDVWKQLKKSNLRIPAGKKP
jgi:hypothetical protein